jgi:hypothetical protein
MMAMPPKPMAPAIKATTKKINAHCNITRLLLEIETTHPR